MKKPFDTKQALVHALIMFATILLVGILLEEFYHPIEQYLSGEPADFAGQWEQIDFTRRIGGALAISVALTLLRYRSEQKKQKAVLSQQE